jgi:hypothetical protein
MYAADPKQRGFSDDHCWLSDVHSYELPSRVISLGAG